MAYELDKLTDYSDKKRADFIAEYNHRKGLKIEETSDAIYALEKNEIIKNGIPIINPNYEAECASERQKKFERDFFQTSFGWIRRQVRMKDGTTKDFLADLLLQIKAGIELGQEVNVITYHLPDFYQEATEDYMVSLQEKKLATLQFVAECLSITAQDFGY